MFFTAYHNANKSMCKIVSPVGGLDVHVSLKSFAAITWKNNWGALCLALISMEIPKLPAYSSHGMCPHPWNFSTYIRALSSNFRAVAEMKENLSDSWLLLANVFFFLPMYQLHHCVAGVSKVFFTDCVDCGWAAEAAHLLSRPLPSIFHSFESLGHSKHVLT